METINTKEKRKEIIALFTEHFKIAHLLYKKKIAELNPHNPNLEKNQIVHSLVSKNDKSEMREFIISEYKNHLIEDLEYKIKETYQSLDEEEKDILAGETCSKELIDRVTKFLEHHRSSITKIPAIHLKNVIHTEVYSNHYKLYLVNRYIMTQELEREIFEAEVRYFKETGRIFGEEESGGTAKKKNNMTTQRGSFF